MKPNKNTLNCNLHLILLAGTFVQHRQPTTYTRLDMEQCQPILAHWILILNAVYFWLRFWHATALRCK